MISYWFAISGLAQKVLHIYDPPQGKYPKPNDIEKLNLEHFYTVMMFMAAGLIMGSTSFVCEMFCMGKKTRKDLEFFE